MKTLITFTLAVMALHTFTPPPAVIEGAISLGMGAIETQCASGMKMLYNRIVHNRSKRK